jgi:hypothetical protein
MTRSVSAARFYTWHSNNFIRPLYNAIAYPLLHVIPGSGSQSDTYFLHCMAPACAWR